MNQNRDNRSSFIRTANVGVTVVVVVSPGCVVR